VSPTSARTRKQRQQLHTRPRSEVVLAVLGASAVVVFTVFAIWMLRPGSVAPGTGGIAHRQPRATWLVAGTVVVLVAGVAYVLQSRRWRRHLVPAIAAVVVGSLVLAVVVGALWPSGLLEHHPSLVGPSDFQTETTPALPTTAPPGTTGATTTPTTGR
jgi:hypothetical protein